MNIWEVLKGHNIYGMNNLMSKSHEELQTVIDLLTPDCLRDLNAELWKANEEQGNEWCEDPVGTFIASKQS